MHYVSWLKVLNNNNLELKKMGNFLREDNTTPFGVDVSAIM